MADAQAGKLWFEQSWPQLVALRNSGNTAGELAKQSKPLEAMQQLLANHDQATQLVGDGAFASSFLLRYSTIARETLDDLIDEKHQHGQAIAFVDSALQQAGNRLPDERRWEILHDLVTILSLDNQKISAHTVQESIYAEQLSKLGTDHIDTLATANELAVYHYHAGQYDTAVAMGEKVLPARTAKLGADHPDTLTSMGNLAVTHYKLEMYARAVPILQALIPKKFGREGESKAVLTSMALLVLCLDGVGKKPDFLLAYKPETQAEVMRLAPALKTSLLKTTVK